MNEEQFRQQLQEQGNSLGDYEIVCTFGTGGTSGGLSRYVSEKYGKNNGTDLESTVTFTRCMSCDVAD